MLYNILFNPNYINTIIMKSGFMGYVRKINAIQWNNGNYKTIEEECVEDKHAYLFIDNLPPRKFATYPRDLDDFAVGYCLGEGLIKNYQDIETIKINKTDIKITTKYCHEKNETKELQGIESDSAGGLRSKLNKIEVVESDLKIDASKIIKDMIHLKENAIIWSKTGGVHVAQLICEDNCIIREDVSRHVAVDKVIGAACRENYNFSKSYISYSGRMPSDMLAKIIRVKIPIIISNAAPASSGIDIASEGNITMIGFVRENRFTVYSAPERINFDK